MVESKSLNIGVNVDYLNLLPSRIQKDRPYGIVVHHTCTNSVERTFKVLKSRNLSTHYEIDTNGRIYMYLEPQDKIASHVGSYNKYMIGIDLTHMEGSPFDNFQMVSLGILIGGLCDKFDIVKAVAPEDAIYYKTDEPLPFNRFGIYRHSNLASTRCPDGAPIELYL